MLKRISDLNMVYKSPEVVHWESPGGVLYRYERERGAVGRGHPGAFLSHHFEWFVLQDNDLAHAKRKVFHLINEDEA